MLARTYGVMIPLDTITVHSSKTSPRSATMQKPPYEEWRNFRWWLFLLCFCISSWARGPYWDQAGSVGTLNESWVTWPEIEYAPWSTGYARIHNDLVTLAINKTSWCECRLLCQAELKCLSVGVRALGDGHVNCLLSHQRGNPRNMTSQPGYEHFQKTGIARLGDACVNHTECYANDIYSYCTDGKCECKAGSYLKDGVCTVECPPDWIRVELSNRTECYYLSRLKAKPEIAIEKCSAKPNSKAYLASIKDMDEQRALAGIMKRYFIWSDRILFGLNHHNGKFAYTLPEGSLVPDDQQPEVTFFAWGGNEPNNPTEHCHVMFQGYDWRWADVNCKFEYFYLCKLTVDV